MMRKLLILAALLCACGESSPEPSQNLGIMQKIRASWQFWKTEKPEMYSYTIHQTSSDEKHMRNWTTTIYVEHDTVKCRYHNQVDDLSVSLWLESSKMDTLGKHIEGAPNRTVDELYSTCFSLAKHDTNQELIYEEKDNILSSCYFSSELYPNFEKIQITEIDGNTCALRRHPTKSYKP